MRLPENVEMAKMALGSTRVNDIVSPKVEDVKSRENVPGLEHIRDEICRGKIASEMLQRFESLTTNGCSYLR